MGKLIYIEWLIYPVIEPNFESHSYREYSEGFGLSREEMKWFWSQYATEDSERKNAYLNPLLSASLDRLPPAHVLLAEYDVLRTEGELYAQRLKNSGIATKVMSYEGMLHGFFHFCGFFDRGEEAIADLCEAMKEAS